MLQRFVPPYSPSHGILVLVRNSLQHYDHTKDEHRKKDEKEQYATGMHSHFAHSTRAHALTLDLSSVA